MSKAPARVDTEETLQLMSEIKSLLIFLSMDDEPSTRDMALIGIRLAEMLEPMVKALADRQDADE